MELYNIQPTISLLVYSRLNMYYSAIYLYFFLLKSASFIIVKCHRVDSGYVSTPCIMNL